MSVWSPCCGAAFPGHWTPDSAISPSGSFFLALGSCVCLCSLGLVMLWHLPLHSRFLLLVSWSAHMTLCLKPWPSYGKEFLILWILRPVLLQFSWVCLDFIPVAVASALVSGSHPQTWLQLILNHWLQLSVFGCISKFGNILPVFNRTYLSSCQIWQLKLSEGRCTKWQRVLQHCLEYNQFHWIKAPILGQCKLISSVYQESQQMSVSKGQEPTSGKMRNESLVYSNSSICTFPAIPLVFTKWKIISSWAGLQTKPVLQGFTLLVGFAGNRDLFNFFLPRLGLFLSFRWNILLYY